MEVEDLDDAPPLLNDEAPPLLNDEAADLQIEGIDEELVDDWPAGTPDGGSDGHHPDAPSSAHQQQPRVVKRWLLPPSLTPKRAKRGSWGVPVPVAFEQDIRPSRDDAVWRCEACAAPYACRIGLFAHARFCAGREAAWMCEWCNCTEAETPHKASGPNGKNTLCSACSQRYRHGADGMPDQNEKGEWVCGGCSRGFPSMSALGGHRRFCDGGAWRCTWCEVKHADSNGKGPGPDGPMTLCSACSGRFRAGHTGPPARNEEGKYVCEDCLRTFDTISGLGSHRRRCDGGVWRCGWCQCRYEETSGKGPGPLGSKTLCAQCSARWKSDPARAPPQTDEHGRYPCDRCERTFESFRALGIHGRDCDGGSWRCSWCQCKAEDTSGKSPGPDGPRTLCSTCGSRHRAGHSGPRARDELGRFACEKCGRSFDSVASLGGHTRHCDG